MLLDLHLAIRGLAAGRATAAAAILTLALGIGATTTLVSVAYGVLARPLPYPDPQRLVQLSEVVPGGAAALPGSAWISSLSIHAWDPHRHTIGPIAHFGSGTATVALDLPRRLARGTVHTAFFEVLGVQPSLGRFFVPADAEAGAAPVVVVDHELWRDALGGSPDALTRSLTIDEQPHRVIGVAPPGMDLPTPEARLWTPSRLTPPSAAGAADLRVSAVRAIARLTREATTAQAAAEGTALARTVARPVAADMLFGRGAPVEIHVRTLVEQATRGVRPALVMLLAGVGLLLALACANVANLFLSRGVARERELAVRAAIGASRWRLMRETLAETGVVSAIAGVLGLALAWALLQALPSVAPDHFPRLTAIRLDAWTALAALVASAASACAAGALPALRAGRPRLVPALREGAGASLSRRAGAIRGLLIAGQAALAIVLLVGAALIGRSFVNLVRTDPGFDASDVLSARIYLPGSSRGEAQAGPFVDELLARIRPLPGVLAAGASNMAPLSGSTFVSAFTIPLPGREAVTARAISYVVTPGYAEVLRLRLRTGRLHEPHDLTSGLQAVVVNEEFVRAFLHGADPIGVRFPGIMLDGDRPAEIVGVVANVLKDGLDAAPQAEAYIPAAFGASIRREINLVVRTAGDPAVYADAVRRAAAEIRPDAAVETVEPLASQIAVSVAEPRLAAGVLAIFAGAALLLAAVGLYAGLAYAVAARRRELGVRNALGASRSGLIGLVVREGLTIVAIGLAGGVAGAAALTRLMQALLVGVDPLDPGSFAVACGTLLGVALVACAVPAWRAAATDPVTALRSE